MIKCPHCEDYERQVKAGLNRTGSQRHQCQLCRRTYTPDPLPLGYTDAVREQALKLYLEGNGLRRVARLLGVNHQTVANWVTAAHTKLLQAVASGSLPTTAAAASETLEMDELFTFVGSKKLQPLSSL